MSDFIPKYEAPKAWCARSGMGMRATYDAIHAGNLPAIKLGAKTLIDVPAGLDWLASMPRFGGGITPGLRAAHDRQRARLDAKGASAASEAPAPARRGPGRPRRAAAP